MEVSGHLHAAAALPPRMEPPVIDLKAAWPKSLSGCFGEEKNPFSLPVIEIRITHPGD
jgi:hypothetical protein